MASIRPKTVVNNQLGHTHHVSDGDQVRPLNAVGSLSSITPGQAIPLSSNYLNVQNSSYYNQHAPPPLPPRTNTSRPMDRFNRFNSYYSPYPRFSPGHGMYPPPAYGGYQSPYNRYGMPHDSYNSFIQMAEESTRPAFESIESVVDIVGSISMMLESTYHAVYSSYSAIIGVVEQFARLRDHMAEVLSFLALLRGLKFLCLKILYLLRLRKDNPSVEAAWNTAASVTGSSDLSKFPQDKKSPWPFFMFVGLVVGAPWLMFKLLAKSVQVKKPFDLNMWKGKTGLLAVATAAYDFSSNRHGDVSFSAGESLYVAPRELQVNLPKGWLLACNKERKVGLIPSNYLKTMMVPKPMPQQAVTTIAMQNIPVHVSDENKPGLFTPLMSNGDLSSSKIIPGPLTEKPGTSVENKQN